LSELAWLFLKLGAIAFGGPPAHIAMMEDEIVSRRRWLTREQFLDFLGAANLIPGPTSTEMAIYVGRMQAGWPGLLVAGWCFILPSTVMVLALAWAYTRFGSLPQVAGLLYGIKPVVIAIIVQAIVKLSRSAVKSMWLAIVGASAVVLNGFGVDGLLVLAVAGLVAGVAEWLRSSRPKPALLLSPAVLTGAATSAATPFGWGTLFLVFLKIGAILFGGGYVLVAFLRSDLVIRLHWLSERQLLDAVAVGQVTPGPISTAATFIGYLLGGVRGAMLATVGIFLPAFFFVAISSPLVPRLRRSAIAGAALDGVTVGALALIVVVTWHLARSAIVDWITAALAAISLVLLVRYRLNSAWLVVGGAVAGTLWLLLHH
jgi:chromate transporter